MRILHICCNYADTKVFRSLFSHLCAQGTAQSVYVPEKRAKDMGRNVPEDGAIDVHYSLIVRPWDKLLYFTKARRALPDLRGKVNLAGVDLVHAHTLFTDGGIAYRLHRQTGLPFVVTLRFSDIEYFFKYEPHLRPHAMKILRAASKVLFLSPVHRDKVLSRYVPAGEQAAMREKSAVVPNGIEPVWLDGKVHALSPDRLKVAFAGKLTARKQPEKAVEAMELLSQRLPERAVSLQLAGDGELQAQLERLAAVREGRACLLGRMEGMEALKSFYDGCDLLLVPSTAETFGMVYLEAMSRGLPVLYTRGQGFDGQFPEGDVGFAVDARDVSDMADKAVACLQNYEAMSRRCIEGAHALAWPHIAARMQAIYREATV